MKHFLGISFLIFALPASAMNLPNYKDEMPHNVFPFTPYMGVYTGYGAIDNMLNGDGQTAIQRLAIGVDSFSWWRVNVGFELGVQTGNTMRHSSVPLLGDEPIQLTLKPVLDLLVTARVKPIPCSGTYIFAKGGAAYRRMQINDRTNIPSLHKWNGEFQVGAGYEFTPKARVSAFYQGIFAKDCACVKVNPITLRGNLKGIPTQEAAFVGFEYSAL